MHRIRYILITHLHGDHFFGLPGLITSMALHGRKEPLTIAGPEELQGIMNAILATGEATIPFEIEYLVCNPEQKELLIKGRTFEVHSVPLKHRIRCTGFILSETGPELRLNVDACTDYRIPVDKYESIKLGANYTTSDGRIIPNELLTVPGSKNKKYAYITDTIYDPAVAEYCRDIDLLYHESTFLHNMLERAEQTFHTTARQAATIAKAASVPRLLLGHFSARYNSTDELLNEALEVFPNTEIAEEGKTYTL